MASLTLEMAEKAVRAAQAKARELGTPMTATVVDDAGRLVLSARGDGTGFFTPETSRAKAVAAAAFKRPTKDMASLRESSPAFWGNVASVLGGQALPSIGAVPILSEERRSEPSVAAAAPASRITSVLKLGRLR